jgi:TRAP-type uncharacterized transport system substrate-binding protein
VLAAIAALFLIRPGVPGEVTFLAGPEGSTEYIYGMRYAAFLRRAGVSVDLVATDGTTENLRRLRSEPGATVAFLPSGAEGLPGLKDATEGVVSLGAVYLKPLWLFLRSGTGVSTLEDLDSLRVAAGTPGSDTWGILRLIAAEGELAFRVEAIPEGRRGADSLRAALVDGRLDGVFVAGAAASPLVGGLLRAPGLEPVAFPRVDALVLRNPNIVAVRIPEGAVDLRENVPDRDLELVAVNVNLAARDDLQPAVVDLLLDAARRIHRERTLISAAGSFPRATGVTLPLDERAERYYEEGPSPLRRFLPFWLATLVDRFLLLVVTVFTALFALLNVLPKLLSLPFRVSSARAYRGLEALEREAAAGTLSRAELLAGIDEIDARTADMRVSPMDRAAFLELRQYLHDMRERTRAPGE